MIRVYEDLNLGIYFGTLGLFFGGFLGLFSDVLVFSASDLGTFLGIFFSDLLVFSVSDFGFFGLL